MTYRNNVLCICRSVTPHSLQSWPCSGPHIPSTLQHIQPLKMLLAIHFHVSVKNSKGKKRLIPTLFLFLYCAYIYKSRGHVASARRSPGHHGPRHHFKCRMMQTCSRCMDTHSESSHPFGSLLYTALSFVVLILYSLSAYLVPSELVSLLLSLPFRRSFRCRLLLSLTAVFKRAGCSSEIPALLSSSAVLFQRSLSRLVSFLLTALHLVTSLAVRLSSFNTEQSTTSSARTTLR